MALISKENKYSTPNKVGGAVALGAAGTGAWNYPQEVTGVVEPVVTTVGTILETVGGTAQWGTEGVINGISAMTPIADAAAPFAAGFAPLLAGGYLGKKVVDIAGIDNKLLRGAAMVGGAGLGLAAVGTIAAPYLVGGAILAKFTKPVFNFVNKTAGAVVGVPLGAVTGGIKGVYNGTKEKTVGGWKDGLTGMFGKNKSEPVVPSETAA